MRLSIDIPDETHRELKAKAAAQGVTISEIVRLAVERYLKGNFTVGMPTSKPVDAQATPLVADVTMRQVAQKPPFVRPISKADQAKGKTRK